jgi:prevent-host-death family protein
MLHDQKIGQEADMTETVNLAEAKATLSDLVRRAAGGETINIALRGKPVVQLTPIKESRKPIDVEALRRLTDKMQPQTEDTETFMRRLRDSDRY